MATNIENPALPPWYADRRDAGRRLAELLSDYAHRDDVVVLGLARGGVPVAHEIAIKLVAELDVLVVRKIGAPQQPELAMGAVASGGVRLINQDGVVSAVSDREPGNTLFPLVQTASKEENSDGQPGGKG